MAEEAVTKLTGSVVWLDLATGDTIDKGSADRAILRPDGLAIDLTSSFGVYSIHLKRAGVKFEGSWTCRNLKGEEKGFASCTLEPQDDWYVLSGAWNHGRCHWFGRLDKVESF
jgi:hypothetical protein